MKRLIIILIALVCLTNVNAQNVVRQGNTFSVSKSSKVKKPDTKTKYTWKDSKGNEYPIYVGKTGACYVIRTSRKTGNEYKQYLGKEVSAHSTTTNIIYN